MNVELLRYLSIIGSTSHILAQLAKQNIAPTQIYREPFFILSINLDRTTTRPN